MHELLVEFREAYDREVAPVALGMLIGRRGASERARLVAPVRMTLAGRRNFFRTGFALAAGDAAGQPRAGRLVAATAEIAWSCALVLDDVMDQSSEREGHAAAHRVYGASHAIAGSLATLGLMATEAPRERDVPVTVKARLERYALALLVKATAVQTPAYARPRTLQRYRVAAREMNNSTHWAMVGPLLASRPPLARTVSGYADTLALMGKLSNDLADFCGGSTESDSLHKDYAGRVPTFPVLLLLTSGLERTLRARVERHFFARREPSRLTLEELESCFEQHATFDRCAARLSEHRRAACERADEVELIEPRARGLAHLMRRWADYVIESADERLARRRAHDLLRAAA